MMDSLAIKDLPGKVSSDFCETCVKGKMTKLPFNGSRAPTSQILERIHSDLCEPISPVAYNGAKYILTCIDDWFHFTVVFGLKSKAEVCEHIQLYEAAEEFRLNAKPLARIELR